MTTASGRSISVPEVEKHQQRQEPEYRGPGSHQFGPNTADARFAYRVEPDSTLRSKATGLGHENQAVLNRDPEQPDEAHQ